MLEIWCNLKVPQHLLDYLSLLHLNVWAALCRLINVLTAKLTLARCCFHLQAWFSGLTAGLGGNDGSVLNTSESAMCPGLMLLAVNVKIGSTRNYKEAWGENRCLSQIQVQTSPHWLRIYFSVKEKTSCARGMNFNSNMKPSNQRRMRKRRKVYLIICPPDPRIHQIQTQRQTQGTR